MTIDEITEIISGLAEYVEKQYPQTRERDNVLNKLQEAVFWLIYLGGE